MEFISEDDLETFEGWRKYHAVDASTLAPEQLEMWRGYFEEGKKRSAALPKVGLMRLPKRVGQHLYAVAIREGDDLWLTLWVKRSAKGEFFVCIPRRDRRWDPHASYHLDRRFHSKTHGRCSANPASVSH